MPNTAATERYVNSENLCIFVHFGRTAQHFSGESAVVMSHSHLLLVGPPRWVRPSPPTDTERQRWMGEKNARTADIGGSPRGRRPVSQSIFGRNMRARATRLRGGGWGLGRDPRPGGRVSQFQH